VTAAHGAAAGVAEQQYSCSIAQQLQQLNRTIGSWVRRAVDIARHGLQATHARDSV